MANTTLDILFYPYFFFHVLYPNSIQLNENQEPDSNLHQEIVKQMFKQEELHSSELQQNPDIARVKEQLWSDMHWGRKTLQKLLSNLGFV